jgi:hypothetical protein
MAEDLLDIADNVSRDVLETDNGLVFNHTAVQRDRLRTDTRRWVMSKMNPGRYGDKLDVTSGGDKLPVPIIDISGQALPTGDPKKGNPS